MALAFSEPGRPPSEPVQLTRKERAARTMVALPLTQAAFAPFGQVLEADGPPDRLVNRGRCARYDDRASLDFSGARAAVSVLQAEAREVPYQLNMVERHPHGTQTYIPMTHEPYLVMVSLPGEDGAPGRPQAFRAAPGQGVHYHRGTWRSVLTPIAEPGLFALIDQAGGPTGVQEYWFEKPYFVVLEG